MQQIQKLTITRGDTFRVTGILKSNGAAVDLSSYGIEATVKDGATVVASLEVSVVDAPNGVYSLACVDTSAWPLKDVLASVRYTLPSGDKASTPTFVVSVTRGLNP